MTTDPSVKRLLPAACCALAAAVCLLPGCGHEGPAQQKAPPPPPEHETVFSVTVAPVIAGAITETASLIGSVRWTRQTQVRSEVPCAITEVNVREGDVFAEGDLLVGLDSRDHEIRVKQAQADLERAKRSLEELKAGTRAEILRQLEATVRVHEARLLQADDELQRTRKLFEQNVQTKADMVRAQATRAETVALLDQAKARLEEAESGTRPETIRVAEAQVDVRHAAVLAAELELTKCAVRAPFAGAVLKRFIEAGAYVSDGDPLFEIASIDAREVVLQVPERYARHLAPNTTFPLRADAFPEDVFSAKILAVVPIADERSRNLRLRAEILDAPAQLVAGMFVRGELSVASRIAAKLLPVDAVTLREDEPVVFTVQDDRVQLVPVRLGLRSREHVELLDSTLAEGTTVVTTGGEVLFPGAKIQTLSTSSPDPSAN